MKRNNDTLLDASINDTLDAQEIADGWASVDAGADDYADMLEADLSTPDDDPIIF